MSILFPSLPQAMEFQPFKAARAAGLRFDDSMVKGKGKGKGSKGSGDARDRSDRSRSRDLDLD